MKKAFCYNKDYKHAAIHCCWTEPFAKNVRSRISSATGLVLASESEVEVLNHTVPFLFIGYIRKWRETGRRKLDVEILPRSSKIFCGFGKEEI